MTSGYKDLSIGSNRLYRKSWSGSDTPPGAPKQENPYSMYGYDAIKSGSLTYKSVYNPQGQNYDPGWVANVPTFNRWDSLELTALNRAISHVRGHDFSLPVAIGEGRETVGMLAGTLRNIFMGLRAAKKGNLAEAANWLGGKGTGLPNQRRKPLNAQDLASFHLGMRYGWVPALGDSFQAMEAYRHRISGGWAITGRGSASDVSIFEGSSNPTYITCPTKARRSVRVKLILNRELNLPEHLGLNNPFSVAWELLPLSFVFDWALPVGDYLSAISAVPAEGTKVVVTKRTLITAGGHTSLNVAPVPPYFVQFVDKDFDMSYKFTQVNRTVSSWSGYSVPKPEFTPPADLFNWKRVLDVAALGKSLFLNERPLLPVRSSYRRPDKLKGRRSPKWNDIYANW